jgi:L-amino acid N-acyltransferase YncA
MLLYDYQNILTQERNDMSIEIQDAVESDLEELVRIYSIPQLYCTRQIAQKYIEEFFDYHCIKVAKIGGVIKAVCPWETEVERGWGVVWIDSIWVDWEYLGKGLGESLLNSVIKDAKASSEEMKIPVKKIVAILEQGNEAIRNLFEKVGFIKRANIGDIYYENKHTLIFVMDVFPTPLGSRKSDKNPMKRVHGKKY